MTKSVDFSGANRDQMALITLLLMNLFHCLIFAYRMSANSGAPPAPILCSSNTKLPIFVDVNSPRVMGAFEGQRQRLFPSSSSPPLVQTRESSPPAYFLATVAANGKPVGYNFPIFSILLISSFTILQSFRFC